MKSWPVMVNVCGEREAVMTVGVTESITGVGSGAEAAYAFTQNANGAAKRNNRFVGFNRASEPPIQRRRAMVPLIQNETLDILVVAAMPPRRLEATGGET
jgi:hypothetical protein